LFHKPLLILLLLLLSIPSPARQTPATASHFDAVAGEYIDASEPDTPLSFYAKDGKLYYESERQIPLALTAVSATEFTLPAEKVTFRFSTANGTQKLTIAYQGDSAIEYTRTGEPVHHLFHPYDRKEEMIAVRDKVKLHVVYLVPTDLPGPLPILLQRTPYGCDGTSEVSFFRGRPELARAGYIYACGDIRGRYKSQGEFVMSRAQADHSKASNTVTDESTDAYDTIDWLVKHIPNNNGRVGVIGTSYPGFLAMEAGIDPHPAVKAISPQAPMIDVWMGDDFFHNGAFRQTYGYDYAIGLESSKESTEVDYGKDSAGKPADGYDYFLKRGSFLEDIKQSGIKKQLPTWQAFLDHPAFDSFWSSRAVELHLNNVTVPTLTVGGYYDQEDMWGPQEEYARLDPHDSKHVNFLVLGPWRHGSWASSSRHLGALQYGAPIGKEYRAHIEAPFFAHFLKDESGFDLEDTASFQTGSNTWKRYAHFPPVESKPTPFCLGGDHTILPVVPCKQGKVTYVADPANPVPYRHRPIQPTYGDGSHWGTWMVEDQRFVTYRKDIAIYKLPTLDHDMTLTGEVTADLFLSTTGSDGDFVVKVIDQYPDSGPEIDADPAMRGYQLMTNMEIFRGRYRKSFEHPEALTPNAIEEFKWSLHDIDHVFKKGHTLLVEIQSTWFPLYDRNPQTFVPNIMTAKPEDYKPATISIYAAPGHESKLILPVVNP
jgi:putative CocE/NonD family hydrolase